jgi:hypothetical protein
MVSLGCFVLAGQDEISRRTYGLNRAFPARQPPVYALVGEYAAAVRSGTIDRFGLAIGALPMLETARIEGDIRSSVGV